MNKTKIFLSALAAAVCAVASAQTTAEEFQARYDRLVRNVGYSGVGVETLLDRWGEAFPGDMAVPAARFRYYFEKSRHTEIVPVPGARRHLGKAPSLTLKDAEGQDVPYFEEDFFDETVFGEAVKVLDAQIAAQPDELRWRFLKTEALLAYEKESPDLAVIELERLIDRDASKGVAWTLDGAPAGAEVVQQGVGEMCASLFAVGSPACYEFFRSISEKMTRRYPRNPAFVDNLGSYWLVARDNDKQAAKYYRKALKLDPEDYAAQRNLKIIENRLAAAAKK